MWVIGLAAVRFPPAALGAFLLARRLASTFACLLQLGTSHTLLRYIALDPNDVRSKRTYAQVALVIWVAIALGLGVLAVTAKDPLANLIFPDTPDGEELALWTALLLVATIASFLPYSILLAERRVALANSLELFNASGFLLASMALFGPGATPWRVLAGQSLAMTASSLGVMLWYLGTLPRTATPGRWLEAGHTFFWFGLPRGFSAFLDMLILLIGPWLLRRDPVEAGFLLIALTLVRAVQSAVMPLSQIGAIVTAGLIGRQDEASIREGTRLLLAAVLYGISLGLAVLGPWSPQLLMLWLPATGVADGVLRYVAIIAWGVLPYIAFQTLKGIVEMRWIRPMNLLSLSVAAGLQLLAYFALQRTVNPGTAAALATALSFAALGVLTATWLRDYLLPLREFGIPQTLLATAVLAGGNAWLAQGPGLLRPMVAVAFSALTIGVFVLLAPTPMMRSLRAFLVPQAR